MRVDVHGYGFSIERWPAPAKSPQAVLLHGFAGTAEDWRALRDAFSHVDTFALDLPGHNGLPIPGEPSWDSLVEALDALGESAPWRAPVWVGYSFGARLALRYALDRPQHVGGLVLVSPHAGLAPPEREARRAQDLEDADVLERDGLEPFLERWHARPAFQSRRARPDWPAYAQRQRASNDPRALAACLRAFGLGAQPDLRPRLREIEAPALVIAGFEDRAYNEAARTMQLTMPRARRAALAGVGHAPHVEAPDATARHVRDFFASPPPPVLPRGIPK